MQNSMLQAGFTMVNVFNQIISFLVLGAYIGGLVICIMNRRLSNSMIMCIVGFGGEIAVWVLNHLVGALGGVFNTPTMGSEGPLIHQFLLTFVSLVSPISLGILVLGLFRVFKDVSERLGMRRAGGAKSARRRRDEEEYEEEEERPRPRKPGSRDVQR
jgi:hypothetical protein